MRITLPRARHESLIIKELPEETLVYDLENDKAHCLNQTAAMVWKHCDGKTTISAMVLQMSKELGEPIDPNIVLIAIKQLQARQLLQKEFTATGPMPQISRRNAMKALGLLTAASVPLITSIVAPTAAQAASCVPLGKACLQDSDCCSNRCQDTGDSFVCAA